MDSNTLTPEDWLDLALDELRQHGFAALKAQPLAAKLKVTRGSFYYHFESLARFHAAVIAHWSKRTTGRVTESLDGQDAGEALDQLLQMTLQSGEAMERAVRAWATVAPEVAKAVAAVDAERIAVAEDLLRRTGLPDARAKARARLLYWAAIGRLMMPFPDDNRLAPDEISDIARMVAR